MTELPETPRPAGRWMLPPHQLVIQPLCSLARLHRLILRTHMLKYYVITSGLVGHHAMHWLVVNSGRTSAACVDLTRQHRPSTHPLVSPNNIRRRSFKGTRHHDSDPWLLTAREPVSHYFAVPVLLSFACLLLLHSYSLRSYIGEGYISNTEYYTFGNTNVYVKILLYVF
jgi:hypothetical protein